MAAQRAPRAPSGLGTAGKRLWSDITGLYDLRVDELRVLEDACREADLITTIEKALHGADLIVRGSMGQEVVNPLIPEVRQHRAILQRFLASLKLPDADDAPAADTAEDRSSAARRAANARWGNG